MQYVDCDRAEKHENLCLGYGYEEIDEPCEQCQNCLKCESGTYQLGETEKDDQLIKAKEILQKMLRDIPNRMWYTDETIKQAEQFLNNDGCPDVMCEDCTKEDCTVRKLGLVPTKEVEK